MTPRLGLAAAAALSALGGCAPDIQETVLYRSSCEVCHRPLDGSGTPHGIEDAHPGAPLECTDCHGGTAWLCDGPTASRPDGVACLGSWVYDQDLAHASPGLGPAYLRNLSSRQLDAVDPAYLRFVNPGDLRVAAVSCGGANPKAGGSGCHQGAVDAVTRSSMAHAAGEVTAARFRAGKQPDLRARVGAAPVSDPGADAALGICSTASIVRFDPPPIDVASTDPATAPTVANAQEQYLVKSCFGCHVGDFGANRFPGDFRSSGCSACHVRYADDGFGKGADPRMPADRVGRPLAHTLVRSPPTEQCGHCHFEGARIGASYQGFREAAGPGLDPPDAVPLGVAIHGRSTGDYLADEDGANDWDETPPDVHLEAGMHCVDCHGAGDAHGGGRIGATARCATAATCEECHGTVRARAHPGPDRPGLIERDGKLLLRTRVTALELEVPQLLDAVTPDGPRFNPAARQAMGPDASGFSHTDVLECATCHSAWLPSCYGCHVSVDLEKTAPYQTTGAEVPGKASESGRWVQLNDLVLVRNSRGRIAPSMPAERLFLSLFAPDVDRPGQSKAVFLERPRAWTRPDGTTVAAFGQRPIHPHTIRRRSQFMACDRCHSVGSTTAPENAALLDITYGFGSERFPVLACDVGRVGRGSPCDPSTDFRVYQLDALQTRDHAPLVVMGSPDPAAARPLTADEVARMRAVIVPDAAPIRTDMGGLAPGQVATDPFWPRVQRLEEK